MDKHDLDLSTTRNTRYNLSFSLFRLLLKKSYKDITITELCELASVTRTTFYRHFGDKRDIFVAFVDERFEEFADTLKDNYDSVSFRDIVFEALKIVKRYRLQIQKLIDAELQEILRAQFEQYFSYLFRKTFFNHNELLLDMVAGGSFFYGAAFYSGAVYSVVIAWAKMNMEGTPDDITDSIIKALVEVNGIDPDKKINI